MTSKMCSTCQVNKPTYKFNHDSYAADGFHHKCKQCSVEHVREWNNNNRDRVNAHERNRRLTNLQYKIIIYMLNKIKY